MLVNVIGGICAIIFNAWFTSCVLHQHNMSSLNVRPAKVAWVWNVIILDGSHIVAGTDWNHFEYIYLNIFYWYTSDILLIYQWYSTDIPVIFDWYTSDILVICTSGEYLQRLRCVQQKYVITGLWHTDTTKTITLFNILYHVLGGGGHFDPNLKLLCFAMNLNEGIFLSNLDRTFQK